MYPMSQRLLLGHYVSFYLQKLAGKINQIEENDDFFAKSPADADQFLRTHPGISADYLAFLGNFGHRCLRGVQII